MSLESINPATDVVTDQHEEMSSTDVAQIIEKAQGRYLEWRHIDLGQRSQLFLNLAKQLEKKTEDLAHLATKEMEKSIAQSRAEVEKCQWVCRYYAENAEQFLKPISVYTEYERSKKILKFY